MDIDEFAAIAPLPHPVDPFAVRDAEERLVKRLMAAGYVEGSARAQVRGVLRQIASGWGLALPPAAPLDGDLSADGISMQDGLEIRRRYLAPPLDSYAVGDQVCVRDEDGRWVRAMAGSYDPWKGVRFVARSVDMPEMEISDPARLQHYPG